jgi:competence protein ComEC
MRFVAGQTTFSAYPLLTLAAALTCGALLACALKPSVAFCVVCGTMTTAFVISALMRERIALAGRLLVLAFACVGAALWALEARPAGASRLRGLFERGAINAGDPVELTGVIERAPEPAPGGLFFALWVGSVRHGGREQSCVGRVELFAEVSGEAARREYEALELRRGARVRVMSALARPERFRNPGVETLAELLERREADARGRVKSPLLVERLDDEAVFLPLAWLDAWRLRLLRRFDALFDAETAGLLKAALLGNRFGLSRPTAERFREAGTFHILVISGLHITFVGALAWWAAGRLTRRAYARWAASAACVWGYAVAVGAESAVVRAALMFTLAAGAVVLGRRAGALNALGGAALALVAWRPRNLFDPSFQLTFLSVFAIAGLAWPLLTRLQAVGDWRPTRATPRPPVSPRWLRTLCEALFWRERAWRRAQEQATHSYRLFKWPWAAGLERWRVQPALRYAFGALVVTVSVQLLLLPFQVVYFHRLSPASLALNLFAGALLVALSAAALCALALAPWGASAPFVALAENVTRLMTHSVDPLADAGLASLRVPEYAGAASAVYALYFVPLLFLMRELWRWNPFNEYRVPRPAFRVKAAAVVFVMLLAVVVLHPLSAPRPDGRLRVDFLDVGQGDAALLTAPDGTTLLVDAGGQMRFGDPGEGSEAAAFEPDARGVGDRVVSEFLWARGLGRVNYALATHADADHAEGLRDVLNNFRVDALFVARAPAGDGEFARLAARAAHAGVPVRLLSRGDVLPFGGALVEVLWPPPAEGTGAARRSDNDDSIVLRVRYGRRAFLLTGDIEARAEAALVAAGDPLACDALKVAHHGSRTSSTEGFVSAARPAVAVISVGQDSPHGHPHPAVVARWRAAGAQVFTTGERGTVTVSTDGDDLRIETFVGG